MMINKSVVSELKRSLDNKDIIRLKQSAKEADTLEKKHKKEMDKKYKEIEDKMISAIRSGKPIPKDIDFEKIITEQAFETAKKSFVIAAIQEPRKQKVTKLARKVAKPPAIGNLPRTLSGLMDMWDSWKKKDIKTPSRQKKIAEKLKKEYLKKTQETWKKYSKAFREGTTGDQRNIIRKVKEAGRTTFARANTIVATETTKYYVQAKKDYYDQSPDVVAYLFVPIRDMATTKWCSSRRMIVYMKDSKYLEKETPAIHWNCRSDMLPLTRQNPKHRKLIDDLSRRRENRRPAPLPPKWRG